MALNDIDHPYAKLSQTPLAQKTTVCGVPAKAASVMVGLFALVIVSGSHLVLGRAMFSMRPTDFSGYDDIPEFFRTDEEQKRAEKRGSLTYDYNALTVIGGMMFLSAGITAVAEIVLLAGAFSTKPQFFCCWFPTTMIATFLGRLFPFLMAFKIHTDKYKTFGYIVAAMAAADVVVAILITICWGQLAGVERNRKYQKYAEAAVKPIGEQGAAARLLPPGSYPRQDV